MPILERFDDQSRKDVAAELNKSIPISIERPEITQRSVIPQRFATIARRIAHQDYDGALQILVTLNPSTETRNLQAVCYLRSGRFHEAISSLRSLVIDPVTTACRKGAPEEVKLNFALALGYGGQPAGAMEVLRECQLLEHPQVLAFYADVRRWESNMGWLRWFDWKLNGLANTAGLQPSHRQLGILSWDEVDS